jgi:hypothetical protein
MKKLKKITCELKSGVTRHPSEETIFFSSSFIHFTQVGDVCTRKKTVIWLKSGKQQNSK